MEFIQFRIRNYKSIQDSGICTLADGVTVLAGKNEAGKTSLLEALSDFDTSDVIRDAAVPVGSQKEPAVSTTFRLRDDDLDALLGDTKPAGLRETWVEITKHYPDRYEIDDETASELGLFAGEEDDPGFDPAAQVTRAQFLTRLLERIPNFILFSSFEDVLPDSITVDEARGDGLMQDLATISDLDLDLLQQGAPPAKVKHMRQLNLTMRDEYMRFWTQDATHLLVNWEPPHIQLFIMEGEEPYSPGVRSKGKQWHLAFFIRITARARDGVQNVILIDEPGLYLHASAQKDILGKLEEASSEAPVIFATHSPYLIEADRLDRVRIVSRPDGGGTKVLNDVHVGADKEALRPVMTAIGLEMSAGIANVDRAKNVVVEGGADYYYLNAFKELFGSDLNFVFGGGAGNMPIVGTVLTGWGCAVRYLHDNDQGGRDAARGAKRWMIDKAALLKVSDQADTAIEDLLNHADFAEYVLGDATKQYTSSNSAYMGKAHRSKLIGARDFLTRVRGGGVKLSTVSQAAVKSLMVKLDGSFSDSADAQP